MGIWLVMRNAPRDALSASKIYMMTKCLSEGFLVSKKARQEGGGGGRTERTKCLKAKVTPDWGQASHLVHKKRSGEFLS